MMHRGLFYGSTRNGTLDVMPGLIRKEQLDYHIQTDNVLVILKRCK